jgi:hypothetical protein
MTPNAIAIAIAVPLVGWRLYRRVQKNIGRQGSKLWRHWTAAILWPLLITLLAVLVSRFPSTLEGLLIGAAIGAGLGYWGTTLTQFEKTAEGAFFTPNPYLGSAIIALFTARVIYRFYEMYTMGAMAGGAAGAPPPGDPMAGLGHSPLTLVIFGLLAGYYTSYAIGLLRWRHAKD